MKKIITWALAFVFALSFALPHGSAAAQSSAMKLVVDGVEVTSYEQPFMSHDQVLIPVEDLFKEAGYKVAKDKSGKVNVTNTYLTVDFNAAASSIEVDGKKADTEFPLTLQNAGNYVSGEFLATLEGFEVEVSEDQKTVTVTTNRVQDVAAFLAKSAAADLKSVSSALTMDMKMESSLEENEAISMLMDIKMDQINEPLSFYTITKASTDFAGEAIEDVSSMYLTKDGYFQQIGDVWVKHDDELTKGLLDLSTQTDLLAQLEELQKKFTKGVNIFEYDDVYVMTQTISNEEFASMMEEVTSLLLGSGLTEPVVSEDVKATPVTEEAKTEETKVIEEVAVEATEEAVVEETVTDEAVVVEEEATEGEITEEVIGLEGLDFNIEEFYVVSTIDKKTLFPLDTSAVANITMTVDEDTISIKLLLEGTFSNFNAVKEIKVPADVIKKAISMEEYMKQLELEFEKAEALNK
ncbi:MULTISPECIES: DUF6612 family protein [Sporosarcina]|uniref:Copper amine oxidase-like N-terminal domain-containing protein n=1 Tax=Sporosarcina psychrophila TaxID=1476 RepID=A0ABV2K3J0_SPOPS